MAFTSKSGKKFTNADSMRSDNAMSSAKPQMQPEEGESEQSPEEIAQEHGPAHHIEMNHDHEMGVHEVHSDHPSGHHHQSMHGSAEEAHEHAKKLATPTNEAEFEEEAAGKAPHMGGE